MSSISVVSTIGVLRTVPIEIDVAGNWLCLKQSIQIHRPKQCFYHDVESLMRWHSVGERLDAPQWKCVWNDYDMSATRCRRLENGNAVEINNNVHAVYGGSL